MSRLIFLLPLFMTTVIANDIRLGYVAPQTKLIYSEVRELGPAIWRRSEEVTVETKGAQVISAIYVTDLRELKDGVAEIIEGGTGAKLVKILLKSPAVFRGYKFEIEVYVTDPNNNERYYHKGGWEDFMNRDGSYFKADGSQVNAGSAGTGEYRRSDVNDGYNVQPYDNSQYGRKN